jgi:hypothetical protein
MKGWTVLFFIYVEDEETAGYASQLLKQLLRIYRSEQLRLFAFESVYDPASPQKITGTLYEYVHKARSIKRTKKQVRKFPKIDPGNKKVLSEVLRYLKANDFLLERFLLFTWDHGAGFGIFSNDPRPVSNRDLALRAIAPIAESTGVTTRAPIAESSSKMIQVVSNRRSRLLAAQPVKKVSLVAEGTFAATVSNRSLAAPVLVPVNMLTASEINDALKVLDRPVNLVIMMNCWVQMLETGHEMSETVNILIAPETIYYFAGYDYFTILNSIAQNPGITEKELATITIDSIPGHFKEDPTWEPHLKEIVVSAVYPAKSEQLVKQMDRMFAPLVDELKDNFKTIRKIRKSCIDLSANYYFTGDKPDNSLLNYFIDLVDYAARLEDNGLLEEKSFNAFRNAAKKYVHRSYRGKLFDKEDAATGTFLANGFSIFHPDKRSPDFDDQLYYLYFYEGKRIKMARTIWSKFLEGYRASQ